MKGEQEQEDENGSRRESTGSCISLTSSTTLESRLPVTLGQAESLTQGTTEHMVHSFEMDPRYIGVTMNEAKILESGLERWQFRRAWRFSSKLHANGLD